METQTPAERYYASVLKAVKKYYATHREEILAKSREAYRRKKEEAEAKNEVNPKLRQIQEQREKEKQEKIEAGVYRKPGRPRGASTKPVEELSPSQQRQRLRYEEVKKEKIANGTYRPRGRPRKGGEGVCVKLEDDASKVV